ncbi:MULTISPECIES: nucleotide-binding protein [Amycolatopsis]|uniref:Nucleotide-binding protein n=1 Tax=Amycolatopsis albidoflavus TaxID=102226 RepID=A0ABW5HW54_9PSEU
MTNPEPVVAGIEQLYSDVPVAGSDRRQELEGSITFGQVDVFDVDNQVRVGLPDLVDGEQWAYSQVAVPVVLAPLPHDHYRKVTVTATFEVPGVIARHVVDHSGFGQLPTRGTGTATVVWELVPPDGSDELPSADHHIACVVRRPRDAAACDVTLSAEAVVLKTAIRKRLRTATMPKPSTYRLSFVGKTFARQIADVSPPRREMIAPLPLKVPRERTVVIFHGRDSGALYEVTLFLRSLDLYPLTWSQALALTGAGTPTIGETLDAVMKAVQAIIVLLTPDEVVYLKPRFIRPDDVAGVQCQPRPNVLYEAGLALGLFPDKTVLVEFGKVRRFTDLDGRYFLQLDNDTHSRQRLALRLRDLECAVDLDRLDWQRTGDLTPPEADIPPPEAAVRDSNT